MNLLHKVKKFMANSDEPPLDFDKYGSNVWRNVFLLCNYKTLQHLSHTCRFFRDITSDQSFWLVKCEHDNVNTPPIEWRRFVLSNEKNGGEQRSSQKKEFDYQKIYEKRPYGRNLVRPMTVNDTMDNLKNLPFMQFEEDGNGFRLEIEPTYAASHPDVPICLATSYRWCRRYYEINFSDFGIQNWVMDKIRPKITVSEMQICRQDCSAEYEIFAQLLTDNEFFDRNIVLPRFTRERKSWDQWAGGHEWETVTFEFTEYPKGIRKIGILSQGKDQQYWNGYYGPKFGNLRVVVSFPETLSYKNDDDFTDPEKQFLGENQPTRLRTLRNIRRFPFFHS